MAIATKTFVFSLFDDYYHIITTVENKKRLENNIDSSWITDGVSDDIEEFLSVCKDKKYICVESNKSYSLLMDGDLDATFTQYPYLLEVANKLIDLKLSNPILTDSERLNITLSDLESQKKI